VRARADCTPTDQARARTLGRMVFTDARAQVVRARACARGDGPPLSVRTLIPRARAPGDGPPPSASARFESAPTRRARMMARLLARTHCERGETGRRRSRALIPRAHSPVARLKCLL